jgi:PAS domain S-box-containing protein
MQAEPSPGYETIARPEKNEASNRQRPSDESFRLLVSSVKDYAIFMLDVRGIVVTWNEGAQRLKGYAAEEIEGHSFENFYTPEDRARGWPRHLLSLADRDGRVEDEGWRVRKDGTRFWADVVITRLTDRHGTFVGYAKVTRDLTERQRFSDQREALVRQLASVNRELESFAYSISHDLRAPLRAIDGFSQALLEDYGPVIDDNGQEYLRRLRAASQRMGDLIDHLLRLSRVSREPLQPEPVDLSELANQVVAQLQELHPDRAVEWSIAPDVHAAGDPHLLRVVFDNLLGNALKFTSKTEHPRIEFLTEGSGPERVYIVRDNGVGFDMQYADQLFGPFQRLHSVSEFEGTGIGLASVQRIVRRHGGWITAHSTPGAGATFRFTLGGTVE